MNVCVTEAIVCSSAGRDKCKRHRPHALRRAPMLVHQNIQRGLIHVPPPPVRAFPVPPVSLRAAPSTQQGGCYLPDHEEG